MIYISDRDGSSKGTHQAKSGSTRPQAYQKATWLGLYSATKTNHRCHTNISLHEDRSAMMPRPPLPSWLTGKCTSTYTDCPLSPLRERPRDSPRSVDTRDETADEYSQLTIIKPKAESSVSVTPTAPISTYSGSTSSRSALSGAASWSDFGFVTADGGSVGFLEALRYLSNNIEAMEDLSLQSSKVQSSWRVARPIDIPRSRTRPDSSNMDAVSLSRPLPWTALL